MPVHSAVAGVPVVKGLHVTPVTLLSVTLGAVSVTLLSFVRVYRKVTVSPMK